jgi:hypothetical protein
VTAMHKVNYMKHIVSGDIITTQHKAWNDTVRMAMYIDLILKPAATVRGGKLFLWMDNCSAHKVETLEPLFLEAGVETAYLPPNTTYMLQVLDLVVNGPLKAYLRSKRAHALLDYFKTFRNAYVQEKLKDDENEKRHQKWNPPKPTMIECLLNCKELFLEGGRFSSPTFIDSVQRTFLKCGLAPSTMDHTFSHYEEKKFTNGAMLHAPSSTLPYCSIVDEGLFFEDEMEALGAALDDDDVDDDEECVDDVDDSDDESDSSDC